MFEFFEKITPENEEKISEARADRIKTSVLSRIDSDKEETPMNKHIKIKSLIIAAAVATTGLTTLASANTVDGGAFVADEYYGESAEPSIDVKVTEQIYEIASEEIGANAAADTEVSVSIMTDDEFWEMLVSRINEALVYEEEVDGERVWKKVTLLCDDGSAYVDYCVCDNKLWKISITGH